MKLFLDLPDVEIIDFHVHVKGGDVYRRAFTADFLLSQMDRAGIARAVIFSMSAPSRESNELTRREAEKAPDRFIPFAHVLPQEGPLAVRELERCLDGLGWRGVKLHCGEISEPTAEVLVPVLKFCAERGKPVLIDISNRPDLARQIAEAVPDCKLVIAHMGAPRDEVMFDRFVALGLELPHIMFDMSYCHVPWKLPEAFDALGAERILFGSDAPLYHPLIELAKLAVAGLAEADLRKVLHDNAARLLGLES